MEHGTNVAYTIHKCRCADCTKANRDYERERQKRQREGRSLFVPADPVRERVRLLRSWGMTDDEIARAAGLNDARLSDLMTGHWRTGKPLTRMKRENAEAIFAVRKRNLQRGNRIPADKVREMVLDLMEQGYSQPWIAEQLGITRSNFHLLTAKQVTVATALKVKALWESTTEPAPTDTHRQRISVSRTRNIVRRYRKATNPRVMLDTERIVAAIGTRPILSIEEDAGLTRGQIAHLLARGSCRRSTLSALASALGVSDDHIERQSA